MTNRERILELINLVPGLTDSEIRQRTGIEPHQQVNQICRSLATTGLTQRASGPAGRIVNIPAAGVRHSSGSPSRHMPRMSNESEVNRHRRREVRSVALPFADPVDRLFVVQCSSAKKPGGEAPKAEAVVDRLPTSLARELADRQVLNAVSLHVDESTLRPAVERYDGHLYRVGGGVAIRSLMEQGSHVVILSGGYGLVLPEEAIGRYDCEFRPSMWPDRIVERCLSSLIAGAGVREVVGVLSATTAYAKVFRRTKWPANVEGVFLLTPEPVSGAMAKAPRAQGEALTAIATTGEIPSDWMSTDGLRMEVARLDRG